MMYSGNLLVLGSVHLFLRFSLLKLCWTGGGSWYPFIKRRGVAPLDSGICRGSPDLAWVFQIPLVFGTGGGFLRKIRCFCASWRVPGCSPSLDGVCIYALPWWHVWIPKCHQRECFKLGVSLHLEMGSCLSMQTYGGIQELLVTDTMWYGRDLSLLSTPFTISTQWLGLIGSI